MKTRKPLAFFVSLFLLPVLRARQPGILAFIPCCFQYGKLYLYCEYATGREWRSDSRPEKTKMEA